MCLSFPLWLNLFLFPTFWYQLDGPSLEAGAQRDAGFQLHAASTQCSHLRMPPTVHWARAETQVLSSSFGWSYREEGVRRLLRSTLRWPQPKLQTLLPPSHHMLWPHLAQKQILTSTPSLTLHSPLSPTVCFRSCGFLCTELFPHFSFESPQLFKRHLPQEASPPLTTPTITLHATAPPWPAQQIQLMWLHFPWALQLYVRVSHATWTLYFYPDFSQKVIKAGLDTSVTSVVLSRF